MSSVASAQQQPSLARGRSITVTDTWWTAIPAKLHRYSHLASAIWSDGIYLTAWPRVSVWLPAIALLFGFLEGATHWSPVVIDATRLSTTAIPVSFMQMLPLLFVAALLGSVSANAGLMLVLGFALGDYLVAGPVLAFDEWTPLVGFFRLRLPQLYSYAIFLGFASMPAVVGAALLRASTHRDRTRSAVRLVLLAAGAAALQALLVYLWVLVAPTTLRIIWAWAKKSPPLAVNDYSRMLNPWLPAAAAIAFGVRLALVHLARAKSSRTDYSRRLYQRLRIADANPAATRRIPLWMRSLLTAIAGTLLLAGFIGSWLMAGVVFAALAGICLLRNCALPASQLWRKWTALVNHVPVMIRIAATGVAAYVLTSFLLQMPGWTLRANNIPGDFRVVLACIGGGLLIVVVVLPYTAEPVSTVSESVWSSLPPHLLRATRVILFVAVLGAGARASAICLDPFCCFDNPGAAALAIAAIIVLGAIGIGGILVIGAEAGAIGAAAAAEAAAADAAAAAAAEAAAADAAAAAEVGAAEISPAATTVPPPGGLGVADTVPVSPPISPAATTVPPPAGPGNPPLGAPFDNWLDAIAYVYGN